jgi:excisionase family DNA binding protein
MLKTRAGDIVGTHDDTLYVDIQGACRLTGLGRSKLYELLGNGEIQSLKVGRRRIVTMAALRDFLNRLQADKTA